MPARTDRLSATRKPLATSVPPVPRSAPPAVDVVTATAGEEPPVSDPVAVICATLVLARAPTNVTEIALPGCGPPEAVTLPEPMLLSATRAAWTWAAVAL